MKDINNSKKIIFVEGDDDFHFLCNLLEIQGITDVFVEKLNEAVSLDQESYNNISQHALEFAWEFVNDKSIFEQNKRLFLVLPKGSYPIK